MEDSQVGSHSDLYSGYDSSSTTNFDSTIGSSCGFGSATNSRSTIIDPFLHATSRLAMGISPQSNQ